jgi:hypothetical protein
MARIPRLRKDGLVDRRSFARFSRSRPRRKNRVGPPPPIA